MDCLFCKIANGEIPSKKVYEDDKVLCFHDIDPKAPVHILCIPKVHIDGADAVTKENSAVIAHTFEVLSKLAAELELSKGWRVVTNVGEHGGQSVRHLHFHMLGGRSLEWPPG